MSARRLTVLFSTAATMAGGHYGDLKKKFSFIHDQVIAGAGLTVHGTGLLPYPGEGLVRDGLSYVANAMHNI